MMFWPITLWVALALWQTGFGRPQLGPPTAPRFPKKIILPASAVGSIATLIAIGATAPPAPALASASTASVTSTTSSTPTLVVVPSAITATATTSPTTPPPTTPSPTPARVATTSPTPGPAPKPAPKAAPAPKPAPKAAPALAPKPVPKPVPELPPACNTNYSGCVPIASDVDCAGGSGNGPAYVRGPVRVVGKDVYDLDRDGDGVACE
jgi:outer membrane biosynthesis protein TonB